MNCAVIGTRGIRWSGLVESLTPIEGAKLSKGFDLPYFLVVDFLQGYRNLNIQTPVSQTFLTNPACRKDTKRITFRLSTKAHAGDDRFADFVGLTDGTGFRTKVCRIDLRLGTHTRENFSGICAQGGYDGLAGWVSP